MPTDSAGDPARDPEPPVLLTLRIATRPLPEGFRVALLPNDEHPAEIRVEITSRLRRTLAAEMEETGWGAAPTDAQIVLFLLGLLCRHLGVRRTVRPVSASEATARVIEWSLS